MTGAFLRVKRDDKWENVEVEHLTETELVAAFAHRDQQALVSWISLLCEKIRQLEPILNELETEGVIEFVRDDDETVRSDL